MGNGNCPKWLSSQTNSNNAKVWYINQDQSFEVPLAYTFKQLKNQLDKINPAKKYVYFSWVLLTQKDNTKTLNQIISNQITLFPQNKDQNKVFIVIEDNIVSEKLSKTKTKYDILYDKLKLIQKEKQSQSSNFQLGSSGNMLFEGRLNAILSSSINYALQKSNTSKNKLLQHNKQNIQINKQSSQSSFIGNFLDTLGLAMDHLKNMDNQQIMQKMKSAFNGAKDFTEFDPKFVFYLEEIYLKFMIKSQGKLHYINYKTFDDFKIQSIPSNSKIGIIGDFGTGLKDSLQLLRNMILKHDVNIVLHLGDVYYAGTPEEYERSIIKPLNELRISSKREIRFYSIPGNHDYYSWGLPFLCFVKTINSSQFQKQNASYFCLRDEQNKWQFLGMDTSFYDSNPMNQLQPFTVGPHVQKQEFLWHKHKLQNFQGSTVIMTHHQLFSIHERINGEITQYRKFSCINPMLYAQLFEYLPKISGWFWGHQHSFMLFKQNLLGISKGRLLGNSSFHVVYKQQDPYRRSNQFPYIPFIVGDQQYYKKYIPNNPNVENQPYYALSYAVIDMSKMDKQNNLPISYWCSPCYTDQQFNKMSKMTEKQKNKFYFKEYKLYDEVLYSVNHLKKQLKQVKNHDKVYLRSQIAMSLSVLHRQQNQLLGLNLTGSMFQIQIIEKSINKNNGLNQFMCCLKMYNEQKKKQLYLAADKMLNVRLAEINTNSQISSKNALWICSNITSQEGIFYNQPIVIYNKTLNKSLSWKINAFQTQPSLQEIKTVQESKKGQKNRQIMDSLWTFFMNKI